MQLRRLGREKSLRDPDIPAVPTGHPLSQPLPSPTKLKVSATFTALVSALSYGQFRKDILISWLSRPPFHEYSPRFPVPPELHIYLSLTPHLEGLGAWVPFLPYLLFFAQGGGNKESQGPDSVSPFHPSPPLPPALKELREKLVDWGAKWGGEEAAV